MLSMDGNPLRSQDPAQATLARVAITFSPRFLPPVFTFVRCAAAAAAADRYLRRRRERERGSCPLTPSCC